jgi:hypothetical protein
MILKRIWIQVFFIHIYIYIYIYNIIKISLKIHFYLTSIKKLGLQHIIRLSYYTIGYKDIWMLFELGGHSLSKSLYTMKG